MLITVISKITRTGVCSIHWHWNWLAICGDNDWAAYFNQSLSFHDITNTSQFRIIIASSFIAESFKSSRKDI
jgi:hypothetical protein